VICQIVALLATDVDRKAIWLVNAPMRIPDHSAEEPGAEEVVVGTMGTVNNQEVPLHVSNVARKAICLVSALMSTWTTGTEAIAE